MAMRSKMSLTKELRMAIALLEIPVSGWTCLRTEEKIRRCPTTNKEWERTLVDVRRVGLSAPLALGLLLVVTTRCGLCGLRGLARLVFCSGAGGGLGGDGSLAGGGSGFGCHW